MTLTVAQSVVTDAGTGQSAGYALVAGSPSLAPEDADALQSRPEVTDYLHQSAHTARYRSFFPLPSGAWALTFRFVHGQRRGTYNRVVIYALVLEPEVLEACGHDAFAIQACHFAPVPRGPECTLEALLAGSVTAAGTLPDLELRLPPGIGGEWPPRLEPASRELFRTLPPTRVEADLAWIFAARRYGVRVLFDDRQRGPLLLALACAALPRHDRTRTPWTEHLAGGAAASYFLACAPDPADLSSSGQLADEWRAFPAEGAKPVTDEGARTFAANLLGPDGAAVRAELERYGVSVLEGEELTQWASSWGWMEATEPGTASARELLKRVAPEGRLLRWIKGGEVVVWLSRDLRVRMDDRGNAEVVSGTITAMQRQRQTELVSPRNVAAAAPPPDVAAYSVLLSLASLAYSPAPDEAETLVRLLAPAQRGQAWSDAAVRLIVSLLDRFPSSGDDIRRLDPTTADLIQVADAVRTRPPHDEAAYQRVFQLAEELEDDEAARYVADTYLLPIWERAGDYGRSQESELRRGLQALLRDPARFAEALTRLTGPRFAVAVEVLEKAVHHSTKRAREVAAALAQWDLPRLPAEPAVRGVAAALSDAGVEVEGWFPFLLAEAAVADSEPEPDARLVQWIERLSVPQATATRVLERFAASEPAVWAPVHHAIFKRAFKSARLPTYAARILARVGREGGAERPNWDETVSRVAKELGSAPEAVSIRRDWLRDFAQGGPLPLSATARGMIEALPEAEKLAVVRAWRKRDDELARADRESWQCMKTAAQNDPHLGFPYLVADLRQGLGDRPETIEVLQALLSANAGAVRTENPVESFRLACDRLLPYGRGDVGTAVLEVAASPELWPTSIEALRTSYLAEAFLQVDARTLAAIAQRKPRWLALVAARALGQVWSSDVPASLVFVAFAWNDDELLDRFQVASKRAEGPTFPEVLTGLRKKMPAPRTDAAGVGARFVWLAGGNHSRRRR